MGVDVPGLEAVGEQVVLLVGALLRRVIAELRTQRREHAVREAVVAV